MVEETSFAPYPGLRPFERSESKLFFGRDNCVDAMIERLEKTHWLAVLGSSGTGKSSLVKTGLLAGLEMGLLSDAGSRWRVVDFRPGGDPLGKLAEGLIRAGSSNPAVAPEMDVAAVANLAARFRREGPRELIRWCREGNLPLGTNLLLLVDQFEELFRYQDNEQRELARAFVSLLLESRWPRGTNSPQQAEVPIFVTITMRSEFLGACALMPGLAEAINDGTFLTPRMTRQECETAIVGPAEVCGVEIEDRLVTRLLNDMADFAPWDEQGDSKDQLSRLAREADQLPLMQHALNQMWHRARSQAKPGDAIILKADEYHGLERELDDHAERVFASLSGQEQAVAESVFRAITFGTTVANAVRRPTRYGDLVTICGNGSRIQVATVLNAFGLHGAQFLTADVSRDGSSLPDASWIDISHESLIRQWRRLSAWVEAEGQAAHGWQRLDEEAKEYFRTHSRKSLLPLSRHMLLTGWNLRRAAALQKTEPSPAWSQRYGVDLDTVQAFVQKSRVRSYLRIAGLSFFGAIVGALVFIAAVDRQEMAINRPYREATINASRQIIPYVSELIANHTKEIRNNTELPKANESISLSAQNIDSFRDKNQHLSHLLAEWNRLFLTTTDDPNQFNLVRANLVTSGLLYLLSKDRTSSGVPKVLNPIRDFIANVERKNEKIDFATAEAFYYLLTMLAAAADSDAATDNDERAQRLPIVLSALSDILNVLERFKAYGDAKTDNLISTHEWVARTWSRRCLAELNANSSFDFGKCAENAINAYSAALALHGKLETTPKSWIAQAHLHQAMLDLYVYEAGVASSDIRKKQLRETRALELRDLIRLAAPESESKFRDLKDRFGQAAGWSQYLRDLRSQISQPSKQIEVWLNEPDPDFALRREAWIADRLNELGAFYQAADMLTETRVAYVMQFQIRHALADKTAIERASRKLQSLAGESAVPMRAAGSEKAPNPPNPDEQARLAETRTQARLLREFPNDLAKRRLVRVIAAVFFLEARPTREHAVVGALLDSCIELMEPLVAGANSDLSKAGETPESLQNVEALAGCYRYKGSWAGFEARLTEADKRAVKLQLYQDARRAYLAAAGLYQRVLAGSVRSTPLEVIETFAQDLIRSLQNAASAQYNYSILSADQHAMLEALRDSERALNVSATSDRATELAARYGVHSFYLTMAGKPSDALAAASTAAQLRYGSDKAPAELQERLGQPHDVDELMISINYAHAQLFSGNFEIADKIYRAVTDKIFGSRSGRTEIIDDFRGFRTIGYTTPRMCDIGKMVNDEAYANQTCDAPIPASPPNPTQPPTPAPPN